MLGVLLFYGLPCFAAAVLKPDLKNNSEKFVTESVVPTAAIIKIRFAGYTRADNSKIDPPEPLPKLIFAITTPNEKPLPIKVEEKPAEWKILGADQLESIELPTTQKLGILLGVHKPATKLSSEKIVNVWEAKSCPKIGDVFSCEFCEPISQPPNIQKKITMEVKIELPEF